MSSSNFFDRTLERSKVNCIDVGARGGIQSHWFPWARYISVDAFEPDPKAIQRSEKLYAGQPDISINWCPFGLGSKKGSHLLYVLQKESSSSLYPPNEKFHEAYTHRNFGKLKSTVEIPLNTLSSYLDEYQRPLPNLVKLDVQGAELDILCAAEDRHWGDILALQVEVEFAEIYLKQPLFCDVDQFIRDKGFDLFDLLPVRRYRVADTKELYYLKKYLNIAKNRRDISCRLIAGDALYLRPASYIWDKNDRCMTSKYLLILLIYRCYDEALWFIEQSNVKGLLSKEDVMSLHDVIRRVAPRPGLLQRADWVGRLARKASRMTGIGRSRKIDYWLDRSWDF